jgi:hypothetical protein
LGEKVADDLGSQIAGFRSELKGFDRRLVKVETWCEEESPEFHRRVEKFMNAYEAVELERAKVAAERHQENIQRMDTIKSRNDLWNIGIAFLGLVCAICMLYLAVKASGHAQNDPSKIFHSENPVLAHNESAHW